MNVSLTPELQRFVSAKLESGRYNSASEVVREALRLLEEHEQIRAAQLAAFNRELGSRLDAIDRGEHRSPAEVRSQLESNPETTERPAREVCSRRSGRAGFARYLGVHCTRQSRRRGPVDAKILRCLRGTWPASEHGTHTRGPHALSHPVLASGNVSHCLPR
jgi:antitoxin ParD1/3/4